MDGMKLLHQNNNNNSYYHICYHHNNNNDPNLSDRAYIANTVTSCYITVTSSRIRNMYPYYPTP